MHCLAVKIAKSLNTETRKGHSSFIQHSLSAFSFPHFDPSCKEEKSRRPNANTIISSLAITNSFEFKNLSNFKFPWSVTHLDEFVVMPFVDLGCRRLDTFSVFCLGRKTVQSTFNARRSNIILFSLPKFFLKFLIFQNSNFFLKNFSISAYLRHSGRMSAPVEMKKEVKSSYFDNGPGPAGVMLSPLIGFIDHDKTKRQMPAYSLGLKLPSSLVGNGVGPGPAYGIAQGLTAKGPIGVPAYTLRMRTKIMGNKM